MVLYSMAGMKQHESHFIAVLEQQKSKFGTVKYISGAIYQFLKQHNWI